MLEHGDFGMSRLTASVPTGVAVQFFDLLTEQAKLLRDEHLLDIKEHKQRVRAAHARGEELSEEDANFIEDPRTVAQLRADIFLDTVLTATPQSILESHTAGAERVRANISIVVPVLSLLNPDAPRDVATINGMQPMSLAEARKYVGEATTFDRILTDPITGHVLTVDSRNAPPQMRKFLRMRDQTCRFPGCNRVAHRCDLDHTKPYASGGCTSVNNHAHLCRRHHVQKHQKPWRVRHLGNGVLEWTSPLGVVYITSPEPIGPRFTPVEDPAPF